ncbi:MAG: NB-ARC domain-containing protein, partial [Lachnospiraceae bacterium]|nr:NB-ARC domain-containing protein [Lachnospiraceae bacterium]
MKLKFEARDYGYTVIARIEKILRDKCVEKLGIITDELDVIVPKGVLIAARKRESEIVDFEALMENIDFIHIKEILLYKNNYSYVMDITKLSKSVFEELMQSLYELRIKIAHIRSYFTNTDLNNLIDETKKINHGMTEPDAGLDEFIENLLEAPQELVTKVPIEFYEDEYTEKIINNLPIADYEYEGGFVGRADDEEKIIKMLKSNMHRVITIAGAGGVGKSALTLKIVNDIIRDNIIEYDFIVWVSAKENKLSYLGIEDLEPTLKNYDELLDTILNVVGFDADSYGEDNNKKESDINDLFDACNRVLLIIDNLAQSQNLWD